MIDLHIKWDRKQYTEYTEPPLPFLGLFNKLSKVCAIYSKYINDIAYFFNQYTRVKITIQILLHFFI